MESSFRGHPSASEGPGTILNINVDHPSASPYVSFIIGKQPKNQRIRITYTVTHHTNYTGDDLWNNRTIVVLCILEMVVSGTLVLVGLNSFRVMVGQNGRDISMVGGKKD